MTKRTEPEPEQQPATEGTNDNGSPVGVPGTSPITDGADNGQTTEPEPDTVDE